MSDYIDTNLNLDSQGKIKLHQGIDAKKDGINLYLTVNKGEVPFSVFGNEIVLYLFNAESQDSINQLINDLLSAIQTTFGVDIIDYSVIVDEDKIGIKLDLGYNVVLQSIIGK